MLLRPAGALLFFFNDTATTEIYTLSLHDALPISGPTGGRCSSPCARSARAGAASPRSEEHTSELQSPPISYAVFCLKKKKKKRKKQIRKRKERKRNKRLEK